jgi:hypothetical protein
MLKSLCTRTVVGLALGLLATSCAHCVDVRPNTPVGADLAQTLVLANDTANPMTVMPALSPSAKPPLVLQPNEKSRLEFTLRLEENASAGHEKEVVLVPEKSSPYVTQSAIDLLVKARFGSGPAREIRVRLGECLFGPAPGERTHELHLKKPPLSGVPALHLCSDPPR